MAQEQPGQREDSINMGNFFTDMTGWPDQPKRLQWRGDMPGSYHGQAGGLSFADGHSETRRWKDPRTMPPIRPGKNWIAGAPDAQVPPMVQPDNVDIRWLQELATRKLP